MADISVNRKHHVKNNTSPINKTVSVDSGVVQGTSFSDRATPDHGSECPNVPSPIKESDSRDFFPSSATAPSPAMESDSSDFFPTSVASSPAMESNSRDFFPSSATAPSPLMESNSRDYFPSSATVPSPALEPDSKYFSPSSPTVPTPAIYSYIPPSLFVPESSLDSLPSQAEELHTPPAFRDQFSVKADWPNLDNERYSFWCELWCRSTLQT